VCPDWRVVASGSPLDAPVAVVAANRVVACSAAARAEGVETGLRRRQAEARCPGLLLVADDPGRDARAFEPVVMAVEAFTPAVEILRPGACALATRGPSRYFGGDRALAEAVAAAVDGVLAGLGAGVPRCRVGVADGRLAAGLAARSAGPDPTRPDSTVVPAGESRSFLAHFPVSVLPGELPELLVRLGIRTLGDLAALPMPAVLARFGTEGATACRRARGLDERPLAARTPPPDLVVTAELDPPADRVDTIAFVARSLAEELHQALAGRGLAATRVLVEAETDHGDTLARRWHHDGGLTAAAMAERVRWQLDGWLGGRPMASGGAGAAAAAGAAEDPVDEGSGGMVLLRLTPEEVGPDEGRQQGFWGGDRAAAERAARALARVQGVLGPASVVTANVRGGRGPGEQVSLIPWGDAPPAATTSTPPWPGRIPPPAPATVHPEPLAAEVTDTDGRPVAVTGRATASAAPAWLTLPGKPPVEVGAWAGPWPVDERWWDPPAHRRRARAQVVTADGAAHLLAVEAGRWSVEATYD
jgi:protein ImuB